MTATCDLRSTSTTTRTTSRRSLPPSPESDSRPTSWELGKGWPHRRAKTLLPIFPLPTRLGGSGGNRAEQASPVRHCVNGDSGGARACRHPPDPGGGACASVARARRDGGEIVVVVQNRFTSVVRLKIGGSPHSARNRDCSNDVAAQRLWRAHHPDSFTREGALPFRVGGRLHGSCAAKVVGATNRDLAADIGRSGRERQRSDGQPPVRSRWPIAPRCGRLSATCGGRLSSAHHRRSLPAHAW